MQNKTFLHDLTPDIIKQLILPFLGVKDTFELALVSKITKYICERHRMQMIADKLLLQVMRGEQDKAEKILKHHPELLVMSGTATNYSGRTFNTTAFRYALWALDTRYMCNMMLDCLPDSSQGKAIQQALLTQFKAHDQYGEKYELNGETIYEKHYNFSPLIEALQTYINHHDDWVNVFPYPDAMKNQWSNVVGLAQRYVPAHVAQHYCDRDKPFMQTPAFNEEIFQRILELQYTFNGKDKLWFPLSSTSGLGIDFGVAGNGYGLVCGYLPTAKVVATSDLNTMTALCKVRTNDLVWLMQRLESPNTKPGTDPDEHEPRGCVIP